MPDLLFCDNETNAARLFGTNGDKGTSRMRFTTTSSHGNRAAVNPERTGTKAAVALHR